MFFGQTHVDRASRVFISGVEGALVKRALLDAFGGDERHVEHDKRAALDLDSTDLSSRLDRRDDEDTRKVYEELLGRPS